MKKIFFGTFAVCLFFFVLCFPRESFEAARSGLLLWYGTLLPSLLPAMILSRILLDSGIACRPVRLLFGPAARLLSLSPYGVYAMAVGFLCGCPMGIKVLSDLRRTDRISREEAVYLAPFCSNISPSFLCNYLVLQHLQDPGLTAPTLLIVLGAPLLYGLFSNHRYQTRRGRKALREDKNQAPATAISFAVADACISDSIFSITKLGGYIVLFSILGSVIDLFPLRAPLFAALLKGITEVSVGVHSVCALPVSFPCRYLLVTALAAFGGFCCMAQCSAMLAEIGLSLRGYLRARLLITVIAVLMAACFLMSA